MMRLACGNLSECSCEDSNSRVKSDKQGPRTVEIEHKDHARNEATAYSCWWQGKCNLMYVEVPGSRMLLRNAGRCSLWPCLGPSKDPFLSGFVPLFFLGERQKQKGFWGFRKGTGTPRRAGRKTRRVPRQGPLGLASASPRVRRLALLVSRETFVWEVKPLVGTHVTFLVYCGLVVEIQAPNCSN